MKLDNRGWGMREMILLSSGLFIALLVAIFFISRLYGSFEKATQNGQYFELESSLEAAASEYVYDNDISINGTYKISYSTLKNKGYIDSLEDKDGNKCTGYVIMDDTYEEAEYKGYVSCDNYVSEGY